MIRTARLVAKNRVPTTASTSASISRMPIPNKTGDDGSIEMPIQAVFPVDITTDPMTYTMPCTLTQGGVTVGISATSLVGGISFITPLLGASSVQYLVNVFNGNAEAARTPITFKLATTAAIGTTALWTPTAGKKFRVMGYTVTIPNNTTTAAGSIITLQDAAANVFYLAALGATTAGIAYAVVLPGNGYFSSAVNNVLNINCTAALTAGGVYVNVYGTEE